MRRLDRLESLVFARLRRAFDQEVVRMKEGHAAQISVRMSSDLLQQVDEVAERLGLGRNQTIRLAISEMCAEGATGGLVGAARVLRAAIRASQSKTKARRRGRIRAAGEMGIYLHATSFYR